MSHASRAHSPRQNVLTGIGFMGKRRGAGAPASGHLSFTEWSSLPGEREFMIRKARSWVSSPKLRRRVDPDDLFHEACARICTEPPKPVGQWRSFCSVTMRRIAIDMTRGPEYDLASGLAPDESPAGLDKLPFDLLTAIDFINELRRKLTAEEETVINYVLEWKNLTEIAKTTGQSYRQVRMHWARLIIKAKKLWGEKNA
jgi:DNA-directed RNA polymerase specialized sigma24 family protein